MTTLLSSEPLSAASAPTDGATASLFVEPWSDPVIDEIGHDPRSLYAERYWLPVLGPSTTWMLRRFASSLDDSPDGVELSVEELARGLGLGERLGPNAPFGRTLRRCVDFEMAEWRGRALAVRRRLPALARRHLKRLPESLQVEHEKEVEAALHAGPVHQRLLSQGHDLALCLVSYGDDRAGAEQQLVRWGFEPAVAAQCADWAALELRSRHRPTVA